METVPAQRSVPAPCTSRQVHPAFEQDGMADAPEDDQSGDRPAIGADGAHRFDGTHVDGFEFFGAGGEAGLRSDLRGYLVEIAPADPRAAELLRRLEEAKEIFTIINNIYFQDIMENQDIGWKKFWKDRFNFLSIWLKNTD